MLTKTMMPSENIFSQTNFNQLYFSILCTLVVSLSKAPENAFNAFSKHFLPFDITNLILHASRFSMDIANTKKENTLLKILTTNKYVNDYLSRNSDGLAFNSISFPFINLKQMHSFIYICRNFLHSKDEAIVNFGIKLLKDFTNRHSVECHSSFSIQQT